VKLSNTYVWLRNTTSLLLLLGYFLNVVSFETFHQVVHNHDHSEIHTTEAEEDACHRAIFHGDVSHKCEHKSHVTKNETECHLCKVLTSRSSEFASNNRPILSLSSSASTRQIIFCPNVVLEHFFLQTPLRGPPIS
jgi:NAD-dependent dihydropyrimidine dehydrogenase PreA subunit